MSASRAMHRVRCINERMGEVGNLRRKYLRYFDKVRTQYKEIVINNGVTETTDEKKWVVNRRHKHLRCLDRIKTQYKDTVKIMVLLWRDLDESRERDRKKSHIRVYIHTMDSSLSASKAMHRVQCINERMWEVENLRRKYLPYFDKVRTRYKEIVVNNGVTEATD